MSLEEEYNEHVRACEKIGITATSFEEWVDQRIKMG